MTNAQESRLARRKKILWLAQTAMLAAIIIIMTFTPLGYLRTAVLEITFIMIPVVIGSIVVGPMSGLVLGAVWGLTSFIQCFGMSQFGVALLSINPVFTFIVCVPTRILAGWLSGLIFKAIASINKQNGKISKFIGCPVASLSVALLNTLFFMSSLMILFGNTEYIKGFRGDMSIITFVIAFVGIQGLVEAAVTLLIGGAVSAALISKTGTKISNN
jgi:uncharacterized membrane protein